MSAWLKRHDHCDQIPSQLSTTDAAGKSLNMTKTTFDAVLAALAALYFTLVVCGSSLEFGDKELMTPSLTKSQFRIVFC